jgi:hypothetical protein
MIRTLLAVGLLACPIEVPVWGTSHEPRIPSVPTTSVVVAVGQPPVPGGSPADPTDDDPSFNCAYDGNLRCGPITVDLALEMAIAAGKTADVCLLMRYSTVDGQALADDFLNLHEGCKS